MSLDEAARLIEIEDYAQAGELLNAHLIDCPDDAQALYYAGNVLYESGKPTLAQALYEKADRASPGRWMIQTNIARCMADQHRYSQAKDIWLEVNDERPGDVLILNNLASAELQLGNPAGAVSWCKRALDVDPDNVKAHTNLGFAYLATYDYARGWNEYAWGQGHLQWRDFKQFADEPEWSGHAGNVIVYAEQGLGDQILLSNPLHALCAAKSVRVHVDCHKKLAGLFARSFPLADVHGTQMRHVSDLDWTRNLDISASMSFSGMQRHFRRHSDEWPGSRYLKVCQTRRRQWDSTLPSDKPRIGIAWSGGSAQTQRKTRSATIEQFLPILRAVDAHWVSLEYVDSAQEIAALKSDYGVVVHDYPWATQTLDYDDTAALVDCLDVVVAPATTVVHLAGALGIRCLCAVHPAPHCFFGSDGDRLPYYDSVRLYRRAGEDWADQISAIAEAL